MVLNKERPYHVKPASPQIEAIDKDIFLTQLQNQISHEPIKLECEVTEAYNALEQILQASSNATNNADMKKSQYKLKQQTIALIEERERDCSIQD